MINHEKLNRRSFIKRTAVGAAGLPLFTQIGKEKINAREAKPKYPLRLSACCSSLRQRAKLEAVESAYKVGLDGVSMRFIYDLNDPSSLRHRSVQIVFRDACLQYGIQINSLMVGALIKSEPNSIVWVLDSIKCARNLGANVILLALLRQGFPSTDEEYKRVIAVLKELAPKAGDEGIVLGLECSGSAAEQLRIIEGVKHPSVKIYYDFYNAMHFGYEPLKEIPILGNTICEFHVKNGSHLMREKIEGLDHPRIKGRKIEGFNHPAIAEEIKKIGYKGWLTLETSVITGDPIADTIDNVDYIKKVYDIF